MKSLALWLMLFALLFSLTACYTDNDPWPTAEMPVAPLLTPESTEAPVWEATLPPSELPATQAPQQPDVTAPPGING